MLRWTRWTYNIFCSPRIILKTLPREEPLYERLQTRLESLELMKNWHIYIRRPFCKFSTRGYVHGAWWERSGRGWISVSLYRMARCAERVDGESTKGWEWGETGGIAFMLVVSFGLGNFGRWLVRGAQSGLTDLTWLAEIPRQFPIIRGPDAAAQPSGLLFLFRPPSTPSAWFHSITEVRWLSMPLIHFITVNRSNKHEKKIVFIIFMI